MLKFTLSLAIIFLLSSITISQASELTEISVSITGDSIISLDSTNRLIRANVEIENFDSAGDGYYFMKVTQLSTGKILTNTEIQPKNRGNQIWGVHIAYLFDENKVGTSIDDVIGDYEIQIITEYGTSTATTTFTVLPSEPLPDPELKPKVPDWVRNIFIWYAEERISEDELLDAIQFLIEQGILKTR